MWRCLLWGQCASLTSKARYCLIWRLACMHPTHLTFLRCNHHIATMLYVWSACKFFAMWCCRCDYDCFVQWLISRIVLIGVDLRYCGMSINCRGEGRTLLSRSPTTVSPEASLHVNSATPPLRWYADKICVTYPHQACCQPSLYSVYWNVEWNPTPLCLHIPAFADGHPQISASDCSIRTTSQHARCASPHRSGWGSNAAGAEQLNPRLIIMVAQL